jgi:hypothetical protein
MPNTFCLEDTFPGKPVDTKQITEGKMTSEGYLKINETQHRYT